MKSKEVIEELLRLDPSGETDVTIGNTPIYFLEKLPAFYDGRMGRLIHDETKYGKEWSIIGYEVTSKGSKIKIHSIGLNDLFWDVPDLKVISDDNYINKEWIEQYRAYVKKSLAEIDKDYDFRQEIKKLQEAGLPEQTKYFGLFQNWRFIKYNLSSILKSIKSIWYFIKYRN